MTGQSPDLGRLVEIKGSSEGTGYLIADGLVLTAWHLLRSPSGAPLPRQVRVRLQRNLRPNAGVADADQAATVLWPIDEPGDDLDFALVSLSSRRADNPPDSFEPSIPWAPLGQWGEVEVTSVGYPDAAIDAARSRRDTKGITGRIQLADNIRALADGRGLLTIRLKDEDTPPQPAAVAWPAMSGAPVFAGQVLVGIIRIVGEERSRHQLHALPIDRLFCREDVVAAIRNAGHPIPPCVALSAGPMVFARSALNVWNVPYPRNLEFAGREHVIERLAAELSSGSPAAVTQAIAGLGGIGKTQLALEYCYRHRDSYRVVWWIRAESKKTRIADLIALGQHLSPHIEVADEGEAVRLIVDRLDQSPGWLLVFDNVENPSDLSGLLPTAGRGHVLITSRHATWAERAKVVTLDVWTEEEASAYLITRTHKQQPVAQETARAAAKLAELLGRLPLAVEQAAAYIDECGMGLIEYTRLFSKEQSRLLQLRQPQNKRDQQTVATVWEISLRRVETASPGAVGLLKLCAFLRPDQISKRTIEKYHKAMPEPLRTTAADALELHDAIAVLRRYSLVNVSDDFLSVHRLVQWVVRARLAESEYREFSELAKRLEGGEDEVQDPEAADVVGPLDGKPTKTFRVRSRRRAVVLAGAVAGAAGITFTLYRNQVGRGDGHGDGDSFTPKGTGPYSLKWLPEVLTAAGLRVSEVSGWLDRGQGDVGTIRGVMCHHTAGPKQGNMSSLKTLTEGRPDLPGPFAQLGLGRDGTFYVIAAGRAMHAGQGAWQGVSTGNDSFVGIDAENSGSADDPWPAIQMEAYQRGVAAILKRIGAPAVMCCGHKEYATPPGRKTDPSFDMVDFRVRVVRIMAEDNPRTVGSPVDGGLSGVLRMGRFADPTYYLQDKFVWAPKGSNGATKQEPVTVPAGFVFALDSIPRTFWSLIGPDGTFAQAAVLHDYLYWAQTRSRSDSDDIFKQAMADLSVNTGTANLLYAATRAGGQAAWDVNAKRKASGEKRVLKAFPTDSKVTWDEWRKRPEVFAGTQ